MKNDSIIISGTSAGLIEHYTGYIPRTILDHNQVDKKFFKSNYEIIKKIYSENGIRNFYRGGIPMFGCISISHAWLFYFYEKHKESTSTTNSLLYSSIARMGHDIFMIPGDTIRMRNNISGMGNIQTIKDIYKNQKLMGFFKSSPITLIMNIPSGIIEFFVLKSCINQFGSDNYKVFGYGALAGIMGSIITNPLDIIKTRIQTQGIVNKYSNINYPFYKSQFDLFKNVFNERGIRGLFRGSLLRSFQGGICYGSYELISKKLKLGTEN